MSHFSHNIPNVVYLLFKQIWPSDLKDLIHKPVADPGFPVGGGGNLQRGCFLVKTKELDPVGGPPAAPPWIHQCKHLDVADVGVIGIPHPPDDLPRAYVQRKGDSCITEDHGIR